MVLLGVLERILTRADVPLAPRGDDRQARVERHVGQLEAHLIVALAGAAMRHRVGALLRGHPHLTFSDQRAGDRGAEQVAALIDRARLEQRKQVVAHELLAQVLDIALRGVAGDRLLLQAAGLLGLADIGAIADHLAAVVLAQPGDDDACIEAAGVGQYNFVDFRARSHWYHLLN